MIKMNTQCKPSFTINFRIVIYKLVVGVAITQEKILIGCTLQYLGARSYCNKRPIERKVLFIYPVKKIHWKSQSEGRSESENVLSEKADLFH